MDTFNVLNRGTKKKYPVDPLEERCYPQTYHAYLVATKKSCTHLLKFTGPGDAYAGGYLPDRLTENWCVWKVLRFILTPDYVRPLPKERVDTAKKSSSMAREHLVMRSSKSMKHCGPPIAMFDGKDESLHDLSIELQAWSDQIADTQSKAKNEFERYRRKGEVSVKEVVRRRKANLSLQALLPEFDEQIAGLHQGDIRAEVLKEQLSVRESGTYAFGMVSVGPLYLVRCKDEVYPLSGEGLERMRRTLIAWSSAAAAMAYTTCRIDRAEACFELFDRMIEFGLESPNAVGEWVKATRNIAVADLADDKVLGQSAKSMYISTLSGEKSMAARSFLSLLHSYFPIKEERILIANLYKTVPHPDAPMDDFFHAIDGLREPHTVTTAKLPLFEAILRRSVYLSLMKCDHDIRVTHPDPVNPVAIESQSTTKSVNSMSEIAVDQWVGATFARDRKLVSMKDIELRASDKASFVKEEVTHEELESLVSWSWELGPLTSPPPALLKVLHNINDVESEMNGESLLAFGPAWERFNNVVRKHEEFEARYPGMSPEDIPSSHLAQFLMNDPDARYLVASEPKLGEYHKEVTRLFYIAEQQLKAITQRVERIARQISRLQRGVSIVKSYRHRRSDLETFCSAMNQKIEGQTNVFISFDMTRFSMKFPMVLLRKYGEVLAELTGDDALRRLDIIFRSSVVLHNSRGYFNYLAGAKGAFEGFLNFTWSSIHAMVMDCALYESQKSGTLLAFSDDGLLSVAVAGNPGTPAMLNDARVVVKSIQDTFGSLGLRFHLGKTLVSSMVWEYLGDICYRGRILPMWWKEISSFGETASGHGFRPTYDKFVEISSKSRALAKARAPPGLVMYLMMRWSFLRLYQMYPGLSRRAAHAMLVVPPSAGGFRVPSYTELISTSRVDPLVEFDADLFLVSQFDPELAGCIAGVISEELAGSTKAIDGLISGSLLKTMIPDTSGRTSVVELQEEARAMSDTAYQFPPDPVTPQVKEAISEGLKLVTNLDVNLLSEFIQSLPPVKEYNTSLAIVKSRGALRVLNRSSLRRQQSLDKSRCDASVAFWQDSVREGYGPISCDAPISKIVLARTYRHYSIMKLIPSARVALTNKPSESYLDVIIDLRGRPWDKGFSELTHIEPRVKMASRDDPVSWAAEATPETEISRWRRAVVLYSSVQLRSPGAAPILERICLLFGLHIPPVPPQHFVGHDRLRSLLGGRPDVALWLPSAVIARSRVRLSRQLETMARKRVDLDFTTYPQLALGIAVSRLDHIGAYSEKRGMQEYRFRLYLQDPMDLVRSPMVAPPEAELPPLPPGTVFPPHPPRHLQEDIVSAMRDKLQEMRVRNILESSGAAQVGEEDLEIQEALIQKSLVDSFRVAFIAPSLSGAGLAAHVSVGALHSPLVVARALAIAFYETLQHPLKGGLRQVSLLDLGEERGPGQGREEDLEAIRNHLVAAHQAGIANASLILEQCAAVLIPRESILAWFRDINNVYLVVSEHVLAGRLNRMLRSRQVIISDTAAGTGYASREAVRVMRNMAKETIQAICAKAEADRDDERQEAHARGPAYGAEPWSDIATRLTLEDVREHYDLRDSWASVQFITWLKIVQRKARPSTHRFIATIVNRQTMLLMWMQVEFVAFSAVKLAAAGGVWGMLPYFFKGCADQALDDGNTIRRNLGGVEIMFPNQIRFNAIGCQLVQMQFGGLEERPDLYNMMVSNFDTWVVRRGLDVAADRLALSDGTLEDFSERIGVAGRRIYNHLFQQCRQWCTTFHNVFMLALQENIVEVPKSSMRYLPDVESMPVPLYKGPLGPLPRCKDVSKDLTRVQAEAVAYVIIGGHLAASVIAYDASSGNYGWVEESLMAIQKGSNGTESWAMGRNQVSDVRVTVLSFESREHLNLAVITLERCLFGGDRVFPVADDLEEEYYVIIREVNGEGWGLIPEDGNWRGDVLDVLPTHAWESSTLLIADCVDSMEKRDIILPTTDATRTAGSLHLSLASGIVGGYAGTRGPVATVPYPIAVSARLLTFRHELCYAAPLAGYAYLQAYYSTRGSLDGGTLRGAARDFLAGYMNSYNALRTAEDELSLARNTPMAPVAMERFNRCRMVVDSLETEIKAAAMWFHRNPVRPPSEYLTITSRLVMNLVRIRINWRASLRGVVILGIPLMPTEVMARVQRNWDEAEGGLIANLRVCDVFYRPMNELGAIEMGNDEQVEEEAVNPFEADDLDW
jgi:hypothetical protein